MELIIGVAAWLIIYGISTIVINTKVYEGMPSEMETIRKMNESHGV